MSTIRNTGISSLYLYASLDQHPNADPDANYNIIHITIEQLKEKHLASKKVKYNKHKHKKSSCITTGIIKSIKFRDKPYKKLKTSLINTQAHSMNKVNLDTYNKILKTSIYIAKKTLLPNMFR